MKITRLLLTLIFLSITMHAQQLEELINSFAKKSFSYDTTTINYRFYKPAILNETEKVPLILTLHGAGERGDDNEKQIAWHSLATGWVDSSSQSKHPCFVVSPQCPENNRWVDNTWKTSVVTQDSIKISNELLTVINLVENIIKEYPVDPDRVYITGLSMGGFGTWDLITRYPDKFAAAIPMSGAGDPSKAELIKHIPIWVFHGALDKAVPVEGSRNMVKALQECGGNVIYTELPDKGHVMWKEQYENPLLHDWLFSKSRE